MSVIQKAATQMRLDDAATALLRDDMSPEQAVRALLDADQVQAALLLLSRLLPKRYAVAWLCQCVRGEELSVEDRAAASLAENWVRDPVEANRRAAFEFANAGEYESLGAWIAASAGWSSGSLAPARQEALVPPPEELTATACVAAVNMLAALDADNFAERRLGFIARAMELLAHGNHQEGTKASHP